MHKKIVEAALFMSSKPMELNQLAKITGLNSLGYLKEVLTELENDYKDRGMQIVKTPMGWEMQVNQEILPKVAHLTPYSNLSEGCKRTLALVVYKEPVKQSEVIKIQGNKAYSYIKTLIKMGLIKTYKEGHTKVLKLTQEFERYFGEEKARIKEQLDSELKK